MPVEKVQGGLLLALCRSGTVIALTRAAHQCDRQKPCSRCHTDGAADSCAYQPLEVRMANQISGLRHLTSRRAQELDHHLLEQTREMGRHRHKSRRGNDKPQQPSYPSFASIASSPQQALTHPPDSFCSSTRFRFRPISTPTLVEAAASRPLYSVTPLRGFDDAATNGPHDVYRAAGHSTNSPTRPFRSPSLASPCDPSSSAAPSFAGNDDMSDVGEFNDADAHWDDVLRPFVSCFASEVSPVASAAATSHTTGVNNAGATDHSSSSPFSSLTGALLDRSTVMNNAGTGASHSSPSGFHPHELPTLGLPSSGGGYEGGYGAGGEEWTRWWGFGHGLDDEI
ncbi:hypothetical protein C8R47DRAFT_1109059 [Mycena vitilis]|nr:hypothetical protein C8R47DRAFT_1109059 [Mycena vitilis]